MVDVPSAAAGLPPPPAASASATTNLTPVAATVTSVPDKIQQLIRQIQLTGTITEPPTGATITVSTVLGNLTLLLPQLVEEKQNQLLQLLLNIFESQKPVTITVQPGNPPSQVFLLLPTAPPPPSVGVNNNLASQISFQPSPLLIVPGAALPAVVLPPDISLPGRFPPLPATPAPVSFPQPYTTPAPYTAAPYGTAPIATAPLPLPLSALVPETAVAPALPQSAIEGELAVQTLLRTDQASFQIPQLNTAATANITSPSLPPEIQAPQTAAVPLSFPQAPQSGNAVITAPVAQTLTPTSSLQALQPGNEAIVRVIAISAPNAPPPVPQTPDQILARVVAAGPNGEPIIRTGDTTLYIRQSAPLPAGTTLLVTVTPAKAAVMPILPPDANNIQTFQQLITAIAQVDPQLAQQVMDLHVPQPNPMLPATLLFLMSAFKQGSVRSWLGDDTVETMIRAGKTELIAKLTQDLGSSTPMSRDQVVGEWKSYPIPLYNQGQFQVINFHVHSDARKNPEKDASGKFRPPYIRFLIDLRLSKLGAMQFDGLVRPKQLDLILRSEYGLPDGLHRELRALYTRTMGVIDYAGSLNFQAGRQHWLTVQKSASKAVVT